VKEAAKRGLNNIKTTPPALDAFLSKSSMKVFENHSIYNHRELEARHEIMLEIYTKKIQIESRVMGDLVLNDIIPTAIKYQSELVNNANGIKNLFSEKEFKNIAVVQLETIKEISEHVEVLRSNVLKMIEERKQANQLESAKKQAIAYSEKVKPYFDTIRYHADKLELIVDDESWPLPKYRELLFTK